MKVKFYIDGFGKTFEDTVYDLPALPRHRDIISVTVPMKRVTGHECSFEIKDFTVLQIFHDIDQIVQPPSISYRIRLIPRY